MAVVPGAREVGDTELNVMLPVLPELPITNWSVLLPPTDTLTVCATVKQEAGTVARSSLELTKVVPMVQTVPKLRRAPPLNPDPNKVRVNAAEFNAALVGDMELSVRVPDVPEPETVTYNVPEVPFVGSRT